MFDHQLTYFLATQNTNCSCVRQNYESVAGSVNVSKFNFHFQINVSDDHRDFCMVHLCFGMHYFMSFLVLQLS